MKKQVLMMMAVILSAVMMMGDFNLRSQVDNDVYGYADDDPKLLVHDYIKANTPYVDVIKEKYPAEFKPTAGSKKARIDYVYWWI